MPGRCAQMCGNQCQSQSPLDDKQCGRTKAGVEEGCSGVDFLPLFKAGEFYKRKDKGQFSGAGDNVPSERWCPGYALVATEDKGK